MREYYFNNPWVLSGIIVPCFLGSTWFTKVVLVRDALFINLVFIFYQIFFK